MAAPARESADDAVPVQVVDGQGIEIQVAGVEAQVTALKSEVRSMIDSLAQDGGES